MIAPDNNPLCQKARLYYYDFLEGRKPEEISDELWQHMDSCSHCHANIHLLEAQIDKADIDPEIAQTCIVTTVSLGLHFAHVDKPVGCNTVKPFIPLLADSGLAIRTSTPITAHIDHCRQCLADTESLQALKLKQKQLLQLGQILVEAEDVDKSICKHAQIAIPAIAALAVDEVSASISMLKHVCICPECRELLFQYRQEIIDRLKSENKSRSEEFPCDSVTENDLFDYCFPYGIDPAEDKYAKFRPSFTLHVSACPACLGRMQILHRTVSGIIDRAESGIQTVFSVVGKSEDHASNDTKDVCSDSRIEVKVLGNNSQGTVTSVEMPKQDAGQKERMPPAVTLARWVKPLVAAAVFLAILLILHSRPLKATDLSQIYESLEKIPNIHIKTIDSESSRLVQEIWVSRPGQLKIFKNSAQLVLWDLEGKLRKVKSMSTGTLEQFELDDKDVAEVARTLTGPSNILPFTRLSDVPQDARWSHMQDKDAITVDQNIEMYELLWTVKATDGRLVYFKWVGHVERDTKLPVRIELSEKHEPDNEYKLATITEVAYPRIDEVQNLLQEFGP